MSASTTTPKRRTVPAWERRLRRVEALARSLGYRVELHRTERESVAFVVDADGAKLVATCAGDDGISCVLDPRRKRVLRRWRGGQLGPAAARDRAIDLAISEVTKLVARAWHWSGGVS